MKLFRWVLGPIHHDLERYCARKVGQYHMAVQRKEPPPPRLGWRFKLASRLEFRLRYLVYPNARGKGKSK